MPAYATLDHYNSPKLNAYRIRLNVSAGRVLNGVTFVQVLKTDGYIVLVPADGNLDVKRSRVTDSRGRKVVSMNMYVRDGFVPAAWFGTGERFKVKRTRDGKLCICLKEVVQNNGE